MASQRIARTTSSGRSRNALARYQSMRDFKVTDEPRGIQRNRVPAKQNAALPFVVQKHAASRLHYDFRLGWNGVLKSWAVTKGPSYYPGDKRLAVQVEDHPWEYRDFEGTIPKGEYGGGTVMVWDQGDWTPHGDVNRGLQDGHLKFELHGKKLKGDWVLVRMHGRAGGGDKANWLLIKEKDRFAQESTEPAITERAPASAATGRTLEEIASRNGRQWHATRRDEKRVKEPAAAHDGGSAGATKTAKKARSGPSPRLKGIPREKFPGFIAPQLAQPAASAPNGGGWIHELKLDGYRIQIGVQEGEKKRKARLLTRKGLDWSARMPDIASAAAELNAKSAILDGEAVALDDRGVSNFADLQAAFHEGRQKYITYFAFDLLHLDGHNLRGLPLSDRKRILERLLETGNDGPLRFSEGIEADGKEVFEKACKLGAEGIVSKRIDSPYISGRGSSWLKLKCRLEQEFVIGGFTMPSEGTSGIGALLLGYYEGKKLRYAGRAGTGFTQATHRLLRERLDRLTVKDSPFADVPREMRRGARWTKPELVAQVEFSTWTRDNLVRQAAFKGLREDKPAREVVREMPEAPAGDELKTPKPRRNAAANAQRTRRDATRMAQTEITHPEKVLDQESGMTKQQLADYYAAVAEHLLPHITDRPLSVVRCPDGSSKPCFFQKHVGLGMPAGVKTVSIRSPKTGKREDFLTVDSKEGLIGLAQMGVLEIHPWGSRNESLDRPDRIIFDLDPDSAIAWKVLANTALELRKRLKKMGLESFVKSTGGKGLHVVVPIEPNHEWPAVKEFAHHLVMNLESDEPDLYVTKMTKATRKDRIYLDYLRNDRGATAVAPYSPRARTGIPVAMPLGWNELSSTKPPAFHVSDFADWRSRLRHDPWTAMLRSKQRLSLAAAR
jgi:bifunctional non-homologous end joining protein LigD